MSATLVRGLKVVRIPGVDGPVWSIGLLINDGSDFLQVHDNFLKRNVTKNYFYIFIPIRVIGLLLE